MNTLCNKLFLWVLDVSSISKRFPAQQSLPSHRYYTVSLSVTVEYYILAFLYPLILYITSSCLLHSSLKSSTLPSIILQFNCKIEIIDSKMCLKGDVLVPRRAPLSYPVRAPLEPLRNSHLPLRFLRVLWTSSCIPWLSKTTPILW